jgi:ABC-type uncharacterized transport system permease subunit
VTSHATSRSLWSRIEPRALGVVAPAVAAVVGLVLTAVLLLLLDASPIDSYRALLDGAFGSKNAIADTLVKATPLLFIGVGICVAFRAGVFNIGGEGQFIVGALGATAVALFVGGLPGWLLIVTGAMAGTLCGIVWGGIAGVLRAFLGVNEILTTVMLNFVAALLMSYLVSGPWIDPEQIEQGTRIPETERFPRAVYLPRWDATRLHLGLLIAVVMAGAIWVMLWRTPLGYRIRAVGLNPSASRYAGMSVAKNSLAALAVSGGLAGLGGAIQVFGVDHRLYFEGAAAGFTGGAGFNGIVVALFGGLHPIGAIPASVLFGGLLVGANNLQRTAQVPSALAVVMNGVVVLVVVSSATLVRRRRRKLELAAMKREEATLPPRSPSAAATAPIDSEPSRTPDQKETADVV